MIDPRSVLEYDHSTGVLRWKVKYCDKVVVGEVAGTISHAGYLQITVEGKRYRAHHIAWLFVYGELPPGKLDHENLNRTDNRIGNLRLANRSQNATNTKTKRNGLKGVAYDKRVGKWRGQIMLNGTNHYLGTFPDEASAHAAYCQASQRLHGEFGRTT